VALNCPEGIIYSTNLSLFEFGATGQLSWRQWRPGFEYKNQDRTQLTVPQHWLMKAGDGTIRLVANLNVLGANGHSGYKHKYRAAPATGGCDRHETTLVSMVFRGIARIGATNASFTVDSPGVYCARILDGSGEIVAPAMNVVRNSDVYQTLKLDSQGVPVLSIVPCIALQFQLESSTNLVDWSLDPVVYSWMQTCLLRPYSHPVQHQLRDFSATGV
jgi:hypothetical protein